jgi:hypothetical protein
MRPDWRSCPFRFLGSSLEVRALGIIAPEVTGSNPVFPTNRFDKLFNCFQQIGLPDNGNPFVLFVFTPQVVIDTTLYD